MGVRGGQHGDLGTVARFRWWAGKSLYNQIVPLYEYACRGCGRHFEAFVTAQRRAVCPACNGEDLQKLLSSPGMVGTASGRRDADAPTCRAQGGQCACNPQFN